MFWMFLATVSGMNMNSMHDYSLSNPTFPGQTAEFRGQHFEVYSPPMNIQYGEVFWRDNGASLFPQEIISQFDGKLMVVTGFENDIIRKKKDGTDEVVAAYEIYNHHYQFGLVGKEAYEDKELLKHLRAKTAMHSADRVKDLTFEDYLHKNFSSTENVFAIKGENSDDVCSEISCTYVGMNRGAEHRYTAKMFPEGFGMVVHSPQALDFNPMFINTGVPGKAGKTKNGESRCVGQKPGSSDPPCPVPRASTAPAESKWSGLLECPCSTRRNIQPIPYWHWDHDTCDVPQPSWGRYGLTTVDSLEECVQAALQIGIDKSSIVSQMTIQDMKRPSGCFYTSENGVHVYYNGAKSTASCGSSAKNRKLGSVPSSGSTTSLIHLEVNIDESTDSVHITMTGPPDVWFGVGFGASTMYDNPWTLIVSQESDFADWQVMERKLGTHQPGMKLAPSVTVEANDVKDGNRTVTVSRSLSGKTADYYTFVPGTNSINFINAVGGTANFAQHKYRAATTLSMLDDETNMCICRTLGDPAYIDGVMFPADCSDWPQGDAIRNLNPSCNFTTYGGGLKCCTDGMILLDKDQEIPKETDTVMLKTRVYYEEYTNQKQVSEFFYSLTGGHIEHGVPQCKEHSEKGECYYNSEGYFNLESLGLPVDSVQIVSMWSHCHAPTCRKVSLHKVNMNTGTETPVCVITPIYGNGTDPHNEEDYLVSLPPCIFGKGYQPDLIMKRDDVFHFRQTEEATVAHHGTMGYIFMYGALV